MVFNVEIKQVQSNPIFIRNQFRRGQCFLTSKMDSKELAKIREQSELAKKSFEELEVEIAGLRSTLTDYTTQEESAKKVLDGKLELQKQNSKSVSGVESNLADTNTSITKNETEKNEVEYKIKIANNNIANIESNIGTKNNNLNDLTITVESNKLKIIEAENNLKILQTQVDKYRTDRNGLRKEIDSSTAGLVDSLITTIDKLTKENEQLLKEIERLNIRNVEIIAKLDEYKNEMKSKSNEIKVLESSFMDNTSIPVTEPFRINKNMRPRRVKHIR